jgi:hypothetical protein
VRASFSSAIGELSLPSSRVPSSPTTRRAKLAASGDAEYVKCDNVHFIERNSYDGRGIASSNAQSGRRKLNRAHGMLLYSATMRFQTKGGSGGCRDGGRWAGTSTISLFTKKRFGIWNGSRAPGVRRHSPLDAPSPSLDAAPCPTYSASGS